MKRYLDLFKQVPEYVQNVVALTKTYLESMDSDAIEKLVDVEALVKEIQKHHFDDGPEPPERDEDY